MLKWNTHHQQHNNDKGMIWWEMGAWRGDKFAHLHPPPAIIYTVDSPKIHPPIK